MAAETLPPGVTDPFPEWSPSPNLAEDPRSSSRPVQFWYSYKDRNHTTNEIFKDVAIIYGASWLLYPITQPDTFRDKGSWENYRRNFGRIVFDQDGPFWNWFVHPISGSQLFLFYRGRGYSRSSALGLSFISSTLFEISVEIYTEPASIQDLYQTPILGAVLGMGIEYVSLSLLNSGNPIGMFFGHLINPFTLFPFFEGKTSLVPTVFRNGAPGVTLLGEF